MIDQENPHQSPRHNQYIHQIHLNLLGIQFLYPLQSWSTNVEMTWLIFVSLDLTIWITSSILHSSF